MISIISSILSSSEQIRNVVLPDIKNPPVEASLVAWKPDFVSDDETEWASSLFTIAYINFIKITVLSVSGYPCEFEFQNNYNTFSV